MKTTRLFFKVKNCVSYHAPFSSIYPFWLVGVNKKQTHKHACVCKHMHTHTHTHTYTQLPLKMWKMQINNDGITSILYSGTIGPWFAPPKYFSLSLFFKCPTTKRKKEKIKGLNAHVSSQCLVNKKGSIFFTLATVKYAGIDQGMLRLACIKKMQH